MISFTIFFYFFNGKNISSLLVKTNQILRKTQIILLQYNLKCAKISYTIERNLDVIYTVQIRIRIRIRRRGIYRKNNYIVRNTLKISFKIFVPWDGVGYSRNIFPHGMKHLSELFHPIG